MDGTRLVTPSFWTFRNLVQLLAPCLITYPTLKSEYKHQASKCHLPDALMNLKRLGVLIAVLSMTGFDQALLRSYTWIFNDSSHYYIEVLHCFYKTTTLQQQPDFNSLSRLCPKRIKQINTIFSFLYGRYKVSNTILLDFQKSSSTTGPMPDN